MPSQLASNTKAANQDQNDQQVNEMKQPDLKAEEPSGEEVEVEKVFVVVVPATPAPQTSANAETPLVALVPYEPRELPKTASSRPLMGVIGLLALAVGLALPRRTRRAG